MIHYSMTQSVEIMISRMTQGDHGVFGELYDVYVRRVYDFVFYRVSDTAIAEDIVSETFFRALRSIRSFHGASEKEFASWIFSIAYHLVTDWYRTKKHETIDIGEIENELAVEEAVGDAVDNTTALESVLAYLDTLPPVHKDILLMAIWDDLPYDQIAEITRTTESNCRQIVSRTLRKIEANVTYLAIFAFFLCQR